MSKENLQKDSLILLAVNLVFIFAFGVIFLMRANYEFLIYVGVIVFFLSLVAFSFRKVNYTLATLIGLTVWSALHLAGGGLVVGEGRLYDVMLIPLSETLPIFRYDQLVHIWGFGACTLVAYSLLSGLIEKPEKSSVALSFVLVMAGLGMGALNEILEFVVTLIVPESGVGGYLNTSLDLCSNLMGAILGLLYIRFNYIRSD